jgi:hypothetical protein
MDIAAVRDALRREPFEPFAMRLADGRSLEVRHPEFVAVGNRRIGVISADEAESWSVIEPLLIVSLDALPKPGKGGNGSQGKKRTR